MVFLSHEGHGRRHDGAAARRSTSVGAWCTRTGRTRRTAADTAMAFSRVGRVVASPVRLW